MNNPRVYRQIIQVGLEDLNMFSAPQFMHSFSVLNLKSEDSVLPAVQVDGVLGSVDLDQLILPSTSQE